MGGSNGETFYNKQIENVDNAEAHQEIKDKYQKHLQAYLSKKLEDGGYEGILNLSQTFGDKEELKSYLKFLIKNSGENKELMKDTIDDEQQLALLHNKLSALKKETEQLGPKDFEIIGGRKGSYDFFGDSFEYMGDNMYKVNIDFKKRQNKLIDYGNSKQFFVKYTGHNTIEYYNEYKDYLGKGVIDHKQEEKTIIDINTNRIEQTKYDRGAVHSVYLPELKVHLKLKFHEK